MEVVARKSEGFRRIKSSSLKEFWVNVRVLTPVRSYVERVSGQKKKAPS